MAPPPTKRRRVERGGDHLTGCARSEGYYKIDAREKVKYLPHHKLKDLDLTSTGSTKKVGLECSRTIRVLND